MNSNYIIEISRSFNIVEDFDDNRIIEIIEQMLEKHKVKEAELSIAKCKSRYASIRL